MIATTVPHVCAEFFPEPDRFDIDRYAPFGLGTHQCLGSGFVEAQLAVTLAAMLHRADFAMDPSDYQLTMDHSKLPAPSSRFRIKVARRG